MAAASTQPASLHVQEVRDGSWIGNAAWGSRTLTEGGTDPEVLVRRLAARLATLPEADRPTSIRLTRVTLSGQREDQEHELASLLA